MKMIVFVALALVAAVAAAPADVQEPIKIIRSEFEQYPEGSYHSSFETENGIKQEEQGELKQVNDEENKPHTVVVVKGSYSYTNPDGVPENVNYYADETGFHAEGESIPKAAQPVARR